MEGIENMKIGESIESILREGNTNKRFDWARSAPVHQYDDNKISVPNQSPALNSKSQNYDKKNQNKDEGNPPQDSNNKSLNRLS